MSGLGTENLEKLKGTHLEKDAQEELLTTQTECSFVFLNKRGLADGRRHELHLAGRTVLAHRRRGSRPRQGCRR